MMEFFGDGGSELGSSVGYDFVRESESLPYVIQE